jgi:predicted nucleotidyltransferase
LKEALEQLFQRPVDLVEVKAIKNPYFRQAVEQEKVLVYGA